MRDDIGYEILNALRESLEELREIRRLLTGLADPPAAGFHLVLTTKRGNTETMTPLAKAAAINSLDLKINPNGTATVAIVFEDANGNVTTNIPPAVATPSYVPSDAVPGPSVLALTPSADGRSCAIRVNLPVPPPAVLPTGLTVSATIASGLDQQTIPETEVSQGLDVTPAPPGVAAKFALALSEP